MRGGVRKRPVFRVRLLTVEPSWREIVTDPIYLADASAIDRDLVLDFFWKFSVFECALKREGFLTTGRNNGAEPNWSRFGSKVQGRFAKVTVPDFGEAILKLKQLSPQRQIVDGERLGWEPVVQKSDESEEAYVLRLLKTARNNLLHGGKYPDGPIEEIARDRDILRTALTILDGCYELHDGVKSRIDEAHNNNTG